MKRKKNFLDLENRMNIYQLIQKNPGLHQREIMREFNLCEGTIRYHLNYLLKRKLITANIEKNYKRFFISNKIGIENKKMIYLIRKKICKHIILFLIFGQAASIAKLSKELGLHPKTIEYHLKTLIREGIVKKATTKNNVVNVNCNTVKYVEYNYGPREIIYVLTDYQQINDFFIVNKKWFSDPLTKNLIWYSISLEKEKPKKKLKSFDARYNDAIDSLQKNFNDIFPIPFCA